jgi:hypothetical protein
MSNLFLGFPPNPSLTIANVGKALLTFDLWCFIIGFLYFFVICRRRDHVRLRDCLLIGMFSFCLFSIPETVALKFNPGGSSSLMDPGTGAGGIFLRTVAASLLYLPFGLLLGWILWRVGAPPAKSQEFVDAPAFD